MSSDNNNQLPEEIFIEVLSEQHLSYEDAVGLMAQAIYDFRAGYKGIRDSQSPVASSHIGISGTVIDIISERPDHVRIQLTSPTYASPRQAVIYDEADEQYPLTIEEYALPEDNKPSRAVGYPADETSVELMMQVIAYVSDATGNTE